jgi:hypothetical protein
MLRALILAPRPLSTQTKLFVLSSPTFFLPYLGETVGADMKQAANIEPVALHWLKLLDGPNLGIRIADNPKKEIIKPLLQAKSVWPRWVQNLPPYRPSDSLAFHKLQFGSCRPRFQQREAN